MNKSDLKHGNVVETREGCKYLYHIKSQTRFLNLDCDGFIWVDSFDENLKCINKTFNELDIMKVYKDYTCKELLWERKETPKLTEDEKVILRNIYKEYKWITRDEEGDLAVHNVKPYKSSEFWVSKSDIAREYLVPFNNLFQFIKWEDEEPYSIEELLKEKKMIFRQIDSESYNDIPCILVAIDQAYKCFGKEFPVSKIFEFPLFKNNELFDKNGYCSLRKAKECMNYLFKVKSYKFIKGERRKPLKEYDLIGKYIILVKGHYVASWDNTYFSIFNNDNDEVVALWELEDADND